MTKPKYHKVFGGRWVGGESARGGPTPPEFRLFSNFWGRFGTPGPPDSNGGGPEDHFLLIFIFWDALGPEL